MPKIARTVIPVNSSGEQANPPACSPALAEANARLYALRQQVARAKAEKSTSDNTVAKQLPPHLGWGSATLSRFIGRKKEKLASAENPIFSNLVTTLEEKRPEPTPESKPTPAPQPEPVSQPQPQPQLEPVLAPAPQLHLGQGSVVLSCSVGREMEVVVSAENSIPSNSVTTLEEKQPEPAPESKLESVSVPASQPQLDPVPVPESKPEPAPQLIFAPTFKLNVSLAHAFLKKEVVATARIWLLLRCLDTNGRGWVNIAEARKHLTSTQSAHRVCGWRQLRKLFQAGNGTFWKRDEKRIWLCSVLKVANSLEVQRFRKTPVIVPTKTFFGKIKAVRAELFALTHQERAGRPISRATLTDMTGVSARSQRRYDRVAGIKKKANYCIEHLSKDPHESAWQHHHGGFDFVDKKGLYGKAGTRYRAHQLPNSYSVDYVSGSKGRTRQINRQLQKALVKHRLQGNSCDGDAMTCTAEELEAYQPYKKLFFENRKKADKEHGERYLQLANNSRRAFWVQLQD